VKASVAFLLLCISSLVQGAEINTQRAHYNYQMFCQGCHSPDGSGANSVPQMKNHLGRFLSTQDGREYLVRVPGSATSALGNEELAEVLNWILENFSGDSLDRSYQPYSATEVGQLRQDPLNEVAQYRAQLLTEIATTKVAGTYSKTIRE
jgi:mono/diheme cytochrome c family protein